MTVFVVQKPRAPAPNKPHMARDLLPARDFGHLEFIFDTDDQPSYTPAHGVRHVRSLLNEHKFGPSDYIVWAGGDPAALLIAAGVAFDMTRSINWLRWERSRDRTSGLYIPQEIRV